MSAETDPSEVYEAIIDEASSVVVGYETTLERLTIALLTRGHVLLEGVPGVAKTTLANVFARTLGLEFNRIQMTPDLLPADITGTQIYREHTGEFELHRGPVFANIVLADEINRATANTQSALLEAMQERQVTIEGETIVLPEPFMMVATQNPLEMEGVFDLPEAQRDRFQLKVTMGVPDRDVEATLLERFGADPALGPVDVDQVVHREAIASAQAAVVDVFVAEPVRDYLLDLVEASRAHPDVVHGASPRALLALQQVTKAKAAIEGRDYVIPDDAKGLASSVLAHRLVLTTDAELSGVTATDVVDALISSVEPPGADVRELASQD